MHRLLLGTVAATVAADCCTVALLHRHIKSHNTSTKVIFYHMAWQDFSQFDLYNITLAHAVRDHWAVSWDNGTVQGLNYTDGSGRLTYNLSNAEMRQAWVGGLAKAMATGLVDGFFIDITPQALANISDRADPVDGTVDYAKTVNAICTHCSEQRRADLLAGMPG